MKRLGQLSASRHKLRGGFTLIELLVAATVSILLLGLLLVVAQNIVASYSRSLRSNNISREANFVLDMMTRDLVALALPARASDGEGLRVVVENVGSRTGPWLTFISNPLDQDQDEGVFHGAPRVISYRLAYQDTVREGGANAIYALYRATSTVRDTFETALGATNLHTEFWDAANRPTTALGDFVAANVVAVEMTALMEDGRRISATTPGSGFRITGAGLERIVGGSPQSVTGKLAGIEVSVTILSEQGAKLLHDGTIEFNDAVNRFGAVYSRRVGGFPSPIGLVTR